MTEITVLKCEGIKLAVHSQFRNEKGTHTIYFIQCCRPIFQFNFCKLEEEFSFSFKCLNPTDTSSIFGSYIEATLYT